QLVPGVSLPPVSLPVPAPVGNVPVVGPVVQDILAQPQAQQAIRPTLDTVSGLPDSIADAGAPTLLDLRRLRLQELVRQNRAQLDTDNQGQPVRRGVLLAIDPDPVSLQLATRAGFRVVSDYRDPQLGIRTVQLGLPGSMNARAALKLLQRAAPALQADFDHLFEPAGAGLLPLSAALAATGIAGGRAVGMIDGGVASHPSLAGAAIEQN